MRKKCNKSTTQRQIEANRRNARKSTGPRTVEGKRRVCFNALNLPDIPVPGDAERPHSVIPAKAGTQSSSGGSSVSFDEPVGQAPCGLDINEIGTLHRPPERSRWVTTHPPT